MVNKFWALFGEDGVSYSTTVGLANSEGIFSAPDDGQDWIEVNADIHSAVFWRKTGESVIPFTQEEFTEKTNSMLDKSLLTDLRIERKKRLDLSDWTQFDTTPLSAEKKAEWAVYRQALRDLPDTVEDIRNVVWPQEPA